MRQGGWRRLPKRLGRLLSVTNAIEAGTWRHGGEVAGRRLGALEGGGVTPPPSIASLGGGGGGGVARAMAEGPGQRGCGAGPWVSDMNPPPPV